MSETDSVQAPVMVLVRQLGGISWKVSAEGRRDFPDLLVLIRGHWFTFECKMPGKTLRMTQAREQRLIRRHGGQSHKIDTVDQAREILSEYV